VNADDALRKIALLRQIKTAHGALDAEAKTAERLVKALMERYAIKSEDIAHASAAPVFRMTWVYWESLLDQFGLTLHHFGHRGNAQIGRDRIVYVNLRNSQWWLEQRAAGGWKTIVRDWGVESLRRYLDAHARGYSFMRR